MDKIILIDKPQDWTSNDVVAKIKSVCHYHKVGHAGTLDPMATGLLIIGYNEGTKLLSQLILDDKTYITTIKFNIATETGDATGKIIETNKTKITEKDIVLALANFRKQPYMQKPHPYSAVKINGKKAYEYARKNIEIDIPPRLVILKSYKIIKFNPNLQELKIELNVSKGFYVRSFAIDLAKKLSTIAHVKELRRTKCGNFNVENAYSLIQYLDNYDKN